MKTATTAAADTFESMIPFSQLPSIPVCRILGQRGLITVTHVTSDAARRLQVPDFCTFGPICVIGDSIMKLYSRWQNSAGERVRIALNLKGVACEYVPLRSLPPGEYKLLNPQGLLPLLEVDGCTIAQSSAIL